MIKIHVDMGPIIAYVENAAKSVPAVYAAAREATEEATAEAEQMAQELAPELTGELRSSIQSKVDGLHGLVWTDLRYAPYVEFGTAQHGGPQPFMTPTGDAMEKAYPARLERLVLPVVLKYLG